MNKKLSLIIYTIIYMFFIGNAIGIADEVTDKNNDEAIKKAYALYATHNYSEAQLILDNLPSDDKTQEVFLTLSNIAQVNDNDNLAVKNLNKALDYDNTFYKAYYNLGVIFAKKKSYLLAMNNFELAIKYNKTFAPAYYNLALCQMFLKDYETAKKNLIKAIELDSNNKDAYFNLALCYKELKKTRAAQKILKTYDAMENQTTQKS